MKRTSVISLLIVSAVIFSGWSVFEAKQTSSERSMLLIAYNSLTKEEDSLINVSPKDSQIEKVVINKEIESLINQDHNKNKVYKITFNHTATESHGNLLVFIGLDKETVIGKGFDEKY